MSLVTKSESTKDLQKLDQGTHLAICNAVIVIVPPDSTLRTRDNVCLRWEIPGERVKYEIHGQQFDAPMTIWKSYTFSLSEKVRLRLYLEAWYGHKFAKKEVDGFDLFDLVGRPCLLTVVHDVSGSHIYADVRAICKVMKEQEVPPQELESITYSPDAQKQWEELPIWLQEEIRNRTEINPVAQEKVTTFQNYELPFKQEEV